MIEKNNHLVIMAGGVGSRFWPMSTPERPKQFIDVLGCGKTLLQLTVDRFDGIIDKSNIWIVTNDKYVDIIRQQVPEISDSHILKEPCRRNTAPCIAYVSWKIKSINQNANIVVTPSDHIVLNENEFRRVVTSALGFTSESDAIVTLGMQPTRPETGYGYIEADLSTASVRNSEIYRVDSFREKPDLATAEKYIKRKNYLWNAGIFIWSAKTIVNAFRIYQPSMAKLFEDMLPYYGTPKEQDIINQQYALCENISVDYAIMEKAEEIFVFPANFGWSDLGTWGSLHEHTSHDVFNNSLLGPNVTAFETQNCIVHTMNEKKVVVQGLDGYIVAENEDTLLICKMSEEQRIKQFSGIN